MTHKAKIFATGSAEGYGHDRSWDSELSEHFVQGLESDGFDQTTVASVRIGDIDQRVAHYPSTPASKALRLSSRVDIPVRAKIRVLLPLGSADSILRISLVAPTPSSSGIDISRSTMLIFGSQQEGPCGHL